MLRRISVLLISFSLLLTSSCSTTAQDRIDADPAAFAALPEWEKTHVAKGTIGVGMSPDGVRLAWGKPQVIESGQSGKEMIQRWIYTVRYPVDSPRYYGHRGFYGPYYRGFYTPMYYPDYVPVEVGNVLFKNNKVIEWGQTK